MLNNNVTKRLLGAALLVFAVGAQSALYADEAVLQAFINTRDTSSTLTLGVTRNDLTQCIQWAEEFGIPLVAIWSNEGCAHCERLERAMTSEAYLAHAKASGLIICAIFNSDGKGSIRQSDPEGVRNGTGYHWCWGQGNSKIYKSISMFPFVRFYWKKDGQQIVDTLRMGDQVDGNIGTDTSTTTVTDEYGTYKYIAGKTSNKAGIYTINYMRNMFPGYVPVKLSSYAGGSFVLKESEGHRLEAEDGTSEISFEMVRDETAAEVATNNIVKVIGPDGKTAQTVSVTWTAGQTNQTVTVDISKVSFSKDGEKALLVAADANGSEQATNTVTNVAGSGESSANPLWIGERSAPKTSGKLLTATTAPALQFGEWTMDLDTAKATAAAAEGDAYTLVSVQGSLWCPDCANVERNFLSVTDKDGNNRFNKWANDNNVALVAIDVPSFTDASGSYARPTLLSRTAYESTLARVSEYPASGADESLTVAAARSGLGYLTRKGVSDETAAAALERNRQLVTTDFSEGGFHSAADSSPYRTGVPIFVVLDKKGNVAARLTRFASVSPMASAKDDWDNIIKRFDELLAIARGDNNDGGVLENDFPAKDLPGVDADFGTVKGEISHCDFRDIYRLQNFGGNGLVVIAVDGANDADVSLSLLTLDASGKKRTISTKTGSLIEGVELAEMIETAGDFYVEVSGASYDSNSFNVANAKAGSFYKYELSSAVVLVPGETRSTVKAAGDTVRVYLEKGKVYRIEGLSDEPGDGVTKIADTDNYYIAGATGNLLLYVKEAGADITYQLWTPGVVGFKGSARTVTESAGEVFLSIERAEGSSGSVTVNVTLDEEATTLYNSEGKARFEFEPVKLEFQEGWIGTTNVVVKILDDELFDGRGEVVLKLDASSENDDITVNGERYVLTVTDDDKQTAGKVAFVDAEPFFARKATVYARESEGATVYAKRVGGADGYVTVKVAATNGAKTEIGGVETNLLDWANHKFDEQAVKVSGIGAGKSARLTLTGPTDGLTVLSASNTVTVVSVDDDAPAFKTAESAETLYRYVAVSNVYPVVLAESVDVSAAKLTFTKLSGTLPAGLTAKYDAAAGALAVFGAPTAKTGVYTMVYQVAQKVGTKTTPGLTIELTYTIQDPTVAGGEGAAYNEAVAASKSRTLKDIPVIDVGANRLAGVLQVTIPQNGRASAKFTCADGAVSFTAKGWSAFGESGEKALSAKLASTKKGYSMTLVVNNDGSIEAKIDTPETGETPLVAACGGGVWSKNDSAAAWQGYYTVALVRGEITEEMKGVAPRGDGYLTLKMNTASAVNSGTVTYAGMLPNGTAISGTAVLCRDEECESVAKLPVYKRSSSDIVATIVDLCEEGIVKNDAAVDTCWTHVEKYPEFSYDVSFAPYGGFYSSTNNFAAACLEGYETTTPVLSFDTSDLALSLGIPVDVAGATVTVGEKTLAVEKGSASGVTLSFNRSTGVVSGSFKLSCLADDSTQKTLSASYKGVVLIGWGPGCGCSPSLEDTVNLPFVNGAFYLNDTVEAGGRRVKIKRGGVMSVDAASN